MARNAARCGPQEARAAACNDQPCSHTFSLSFAVLSLSDMWNIFLSNDCSLSEYAYRIAVSPLATTTNLIDIACMRK
jgi:hypothetical protein